MQEARIATCQKQVAQTRPGLSHWAQVRRELSRTNDKQKSASKYDEMLGSVV